MRTRLVNLSRADENKKLRFWFYMFMLIFCFTCLKAAAAKAITGAKHIPAIAAHAVAAVRQIPAMALNAISFVWAQIYSAIILTGISFFSQAISLLQTIVVALGAGLGVWGVQTSSTFLHCRM